jgi:hypothetical protein
MIVVLEIREKGLSHLLEAVWLREAFLADKSVILTRWLTATLSIVIARPEERPTGGTLLSGEIFRRKIIETVLRFEITHYACVGLRFAKSIPTTAENGRATG